MKKAIVFITFILLCAVNIKAQGVQFNLSSFFDHKKDCQEISLGNYKGKVSNNTCSIEINEDSLTIKNIILSNDNEENKEFKISEKKSIFDTLITRSFDLKKHNIILKAGSTYKIIWGEDSLQLTLRQPQFDLKLEKDASNSIKITTPKESFTLGNGDLKGIELEIKGIYATDSVTIANDGQTLFKGKADKNQKLYFSKDKEYEVKIGDKTVYFNKKKL